MITKEQLCSSMTIECDIAVHLFGKIPADSYDYRPSPGQRTTVELLRYLSLCGIAGIRAMEAGNFKLFFEMMAMNNDMSPEAFPEAMRKQKMDMEAYFQSVTEHELETKQAMLPGRGNVPMGFALMSGPLKWLSAYKLLLFNYAKASGATDIGTANAWAGIDRPPSR